MRYFFAFFSVLSFSMELYAQKPEAQTRVVQTMHFEDREGRPAEYSFLWMSQSPTSVPTVHAVIRPFRGISKFWILGSGRVEDLIQNSNLPVQIFRTKKHVGENLYDHTYLSMFGVMFQIRRWGQFIEPTIDDDGDRVEATLLFEKGLMIVEFYRSTRTIHASVNYQGEKPTIHILNMNNPAPVYEDFFATPQFSIVVPDETIRSLVRSFPYSQQEIQSSVNAAKLCNDIL